jgi:serine protease AprX
MKKILPFFILALVATLSSEAQFSKHIVKFRNKGGTPFTFTNPQAYLSSKAISRRSVMNIAIDSTDLPITPRYLDSIRSVPNVVILNRSKWLNQVLIQTNDANALARIQAFPFVQNTAPVAVRMPGPVTLPSDISARKLAVTTTPIEPGGITNITSRTAIDYGNSFNQINIHQGQFLHNWGFRGEGMLMAIMDAGFFGYLTNPGIDSLRINNQIRDTWDFVANEASVNEDNNHGFFCLSIIGANKPGQMVGSAPKVNMFLYRTEDVFSEYPIEEQNWVAAAERADSIGIDIFSTSLGYLDFDNAIFDYTYAQRNGNTAMMTIASDLAAKKGIIVCNSAGNNGGASTGFSAWGPNSAGKVKPNIVSVGQGTVILNQSGTPSSGNGTSFSNPNIAGLITCLKQAFPEMKNMDVTDAVQESASRFSSPDGRFGYGIPDMKKAFVILLRKQHEFTPDFNPNNNCRVVLLMNAKSMAGMRLELERQGPTEPGFSVIRTYNGVGNFELKSTLFEDTLRYPTAGVVNYRVKQIIGTDTSFYYPTKSINYPGPCGSSNVDRIVIAPNPVKDVLSIRMSSALLSSNTINIRVTDNNGRVLIRERYVSGTAVHTINTRRWASGYYNVEVFDGSKLLLIKQVLKN